MNYEKKYNEALERAKKELSVCGSQDCDAARQIFRLFPELKENEDERIRKSLIDMLKNDEKCYLKEIAWLEQQGEQKADYSKEDEQNLNAVLSFVDDEYLRRWLKDTIHKKYDKFTEWSEDDDRIRKEIISALKFANHKGIYDKHISWLEKQVSINGDKVVKGVRRGVAISLINHIDANSKGMCLSNMECEDIENAIISEDWDKVYCYMKKKLENNSLEGHYLLNLDFLDKKQVEEIKNIVYGWNKVEPKFKVGDKVYEVIDGIECTIESIDESKYHGDTTSFDIKDQDKWELI